MQQHFGLLPLLLGHPGPSGIARGARRDPAGAGRRSMADGPQDIRVRRHTAVRPVQHLQSPAFHGWPIVHLVTVTLPDHTIRWATGGFAKWGEHVWRAHDPIYGVIDEISEIADGEGDDASPAQIVIIPPDLTSLAALASADAQGGWITIHLACLDPSTGALAGDPYRLTLGELDQPRLRTGLNRKLEYDIITGDARGLQPNEEQRQTDAFRQYVWPGELGDQYATDGTKETYWREDEPRAAVGLLRGRGSRDIDDKAIQFTYEPNAPLAFPFGRCGFGGDIRYRVGYGPTNRWQSVFATVGASGPIKSLVSVSFDDEVTSFDLDDRATNGSHAGEMWFKFLPGDQPSTALTSPTGPNAHSAPAPGWTSAHKLSGRPAFCWTGKENSKQDEYRGGLPKPVLTLEGLFGFNPTDGSDLETPSTWPWINDGASAALNWAIGRWEGSNGASPAQYGVPYQSKLVGGIGAPIETIDVEAFSTARDIAVANGWTMAGVAFSDEDKNDVLEDMLEAAGAVRARKCGMLSCISYGAPREVTLTARERDTAEAPAISLAPSRLDRRNTGIPSFYSEANRWEMTAIAAVSHPDWVAADGGRNTEGYDFRFVDQADQAAQLTYLAIANEREGVEASVTFMPWMMQLEPGDTFDWDAPEYLLDGTKVRVRKRVWDPMSCLVKIDFREETDTKYAEASLVTGEAPPPFEPDTPPDRYSAARIPIRRTTLDGSADVPFTTSPTPGATDTSIDIVEHKAWFNDTAPEDFDAATVGDLTPFTRHAVFGRDVDDYVAIPSPADDYFANPSWVFIGWHTTTDAGGAYPTPPTRPPGNGGSSPIDAVIV